MSDDAGGKLMVLVLVIVAFLLLVFFVLGPMWARTREQARPTLTVWWQTF